MGLLTMVGHARTSFSTLFCVQHFKKNVSHVTFCSCFFISSIVGRKIDKRDAYGIVYSLVMIDLLYFVAKMDQILT